MPEVASPRPTSRRRDGAATAGLGRPRGDEPAALARVPAGLARARRGLALAAVTSLAMVEAAEAVAGLPTARSG